MRLTGIHAPMVRVAMSPSLSARFQSSDQLAILVSTRSSSMSFCWNSMYFFMPESLVMSMVMFSPSTFHGCAPACHAWAVKGWYSMEEPELLVM